MFSLEASVLALVGLGCGLTGAWAVTRLLRAFLYEVQPADVPTFVSVGAGLLAVTEVGLTKIRTHKPLRLAIHFENPPVGIVGHSDICQSDAERPRYSAWGQSGEKV